MAGLSEVLHMDITNVTGRNSAAVTVTAVANTNKPAAQGNSLPDIRGVDVRPGTLPADNPQVEATASQPNSAELRELVGQANELLQARFSDLKFTVDEGSNTNIVRIEDSATGEIIRQFPSEAVLAIARAFESMKQGTVFEGEA
jgi:uncharacterized FlaG/YvyC family protein